MGQQQAQLNAAQLKQAAATAAVRKNSGADIRFKEIELQMTDPIQEPSQMQLEEPQHTWTCLGQEKSDMVKTKSKLSTNHSQLSAVSMDALKPEEEHQFPKFLSTMKKLSNLQQLPKQDQQKIQMQMFQRKNERKSSILDELEQINLVKHSLADDHSTSQQFQPARDSKNSSAKAPLATTLDHKQDWLDKQKSLQFKQMTTTFFTHYQTDQTYALPPDEIPETEKMSEFRFYYPKFNCQNILCAYAKLQKKKKQSNEIQQNKSPHFTPFKTAQKSPPPHQCINLQTIC